MKLCLLLLTPALLITSLMADEPKVFIPPTASPTAADEGLADYFRNETALIAARCLADIRTAEDWRTHRDEYRWQLQEMLGLAPWPERTDLKPVVTGRLEAEDFTVEKLHFQPVPRLYITAAFYLPKKHDRPLPAILLESGHGRAFTNNVSYGNKAVYQNVAAFFARNGYAVLNPDTLSLGEIPGDHLGTRNLGQWWWNSRGYTPAGAEAWTGIRALDYLCARPEVDTNRIGITGHSGGGAYSWTVGALDDRVRAAAPMAGLTDLQNQIFENLVDGHCDCNFFINTYRWDFPQMAALHAPRPLLFGGTDKDRLFHQSGMNRLQQHLRRLYALLGETNNLGYVITPGPHEWNAEGHVAVLRWFNRHLKGEDPPVETAAKNFFTAQQLKVFDTPPADAVNTNIQESFVPLGKFPSAGEVKTNRDGLLATLREKCFSGWPAEDLPLDAKPAFSAERGGVKFSAWDFTSQHDVRLRLYFIERAGAKPAAGMTLNLLNEEDWKNWLGAMRSEFEAELSEELSAGEKPPAEGEPLLRLKHKLESGDTAMAFFAPRGIGLTAWSGGEKRLTQIRRRFMLMGQTLDGMRVWDIRRAIQTIHFVREGDTARVELHASRDMGVNALYAALFEPGVRRLELEQLPKSHAEGPDYLSVLRILDLSQALELAREQTEITTH